MGDMYEPCKDNMTLRPCKANIKSLYPHPLLMLPAEPEGHSSRQLLQNQWIWPRESAAITATLSLVSNLVANGNGAADGLKTGARGLEIARLASNKAVDPWEFDRPTGPVQRPARLQNPFGRRLLH